MRGTAMDGARDGADTQGAQRGGAWACVRGVDAGEMHGTAMCAPRGPGCVWRVHKGHGQGRWSMVHGLVAEAAALPVDRRWAKGGTVAKTGGMAGCCARDRGGTEACGIAWDRGDTGATDTGSARLRHNGDVRAKQKGGVAVDDGARGVSGVAVDGSMGVQRVHGSGV